MRGPAGRAVKPRFAETQRVQSLGAWHWRSLVYPGPTLGASVLAAIMLLSLFLPAGTSTGSALMLSTGGRATGSAFDAISAREAEVNPSFDSHGLPVPSAIHDLTVTSANVTSLAGDSETFSVAGAGGASVYDWLWGDGSNSTSSTDSSSHTYANPGIYLVYVAASVSGTWHDNLDSLLRLTVQSSYSQDPAGNLVQVAGNVVANTTANASAQPVILPGGFVEVSGWITEPTTNPNWQVLSPSFVLLAPEGTANLSVPVISDLNLSAVTVAFAENASYGAYPLNFSVPTQQTYPDYGPEAWSNFTFTIFVGPASVQESTTPASPHPGVLYVYQNDSAIPSTLNGIGEGLVTLDPPVSSNYVSLSILQNVYQTLVSLNGTDTGTAASDFVPNLATCVPGSNLCEDLYGSPQEWITSNGTVYNFVVNPNATFYNASTGAHAPVWPNDVAFSLVRSCMWANVPGAGGDIGNSGEGTFCQDLLGRSGNASWDGGLHSPINNTPSRLLEAITVNNSAYCSSDMMDGVHGAGCVTLSTNLSVDPFGYYQPDFLNFLAYPTESIVSCNWVASEGLGLPGWTDGSSCLGSPPDPAPSDTAWDSYISAVPWANDSIPGGPLQFNAVGSGPYALSWISHNAVYIGDDNGITPLNYTLVANPYWGGTSCQGGLRDGCLPAATDGGTPSYIPRVEVNVTANSSAGEAALDAGTADLVQLAGSEADFSLNGLSDGKFGILQTPTQVISFYMMDLNYSPTQAAKFMGGTTPTLPSWAMQDVAFRNFLVAAYPHATAQSEACSPDGTEFCFQYGGLIPSYTADDTPTNLTWPVSNPSTNVSVPDSAAWWWNVTSSDSMVGAACSSSSPCTFPVAVPANDSDVLLEANAFAAEAVEISNGAIQPILAPINEADYDGATLFYYNNGTHCDGDDSGGQCLGPFPFPLAWQFEISVVDQPSDFFHQMAYTDGGAGMYGSVDALPEALENYSSPCPGPESDPIVTQACQDTALNESEYLASAASNCVSYDSCPASPTLLWNMADHVFTNLSLYVPADQETSLVAFAPWIDPSTLDLNPLLAASGVVDQPFYNIQYLGTIPPGYPLTGGGVSSGFGAAVRPTEGLHAEIGEIVDRPVQLLVTSTGGTGVYHYSWVGLPPGCVSVNAPVLQCTPDGSGNYSVHAVITDTDGHSAVSATVTLVLVYPLMAATPAPSVSSGGVDVGQTVTFSTSATGGSSGPDTYTWSTPLGLGCGTSTSSSITCTPTVPGSYNVSTHVSDSIGDVSPVVTVVGFVVDALPTISVPEPSATSGSIYVGQTVTFSVTASGGSGGPYSYSWVAPTGLGCGASTSASIVCTPTEAGTYVIDATTIDSNGGHSASVASENFTVDALPGPPSPGPKTSVGFLGLPGDDGYYLIAAVGALAIALGAGAFHYQGKRGKGERSSQPSPYDRYSAAVSPAEEGQVVTLREGQTDPAEDLF